MNLKDISIVTKVSLIIAAFAALAVTIIAVAMLGITSNQKTVANVLGDQEKSLILAQSAGERKTRVHQDAFQIPVESDPAQWPVLQKAFDTETQALRADLATLHPLMDPQDLLVFNPIEGALSEYVALEHKLYDLRVGGDTKAAEDLIQGDMTKGFLIIDGDFDKLIDKQKHDMDQAGVNIAAKSQMTLIQILLVGVIGTIAVVTAGVAMAVLQISRPVKGLTAAMAKLASGDNTVAIAGLDRKDEIGRMAEALGVFKDAAIEKIRLTDEAADIRRAADAERARNDSVNAASAREQALVVESVAAGLEQLSEGNLVFRLTDAFTAEYEKLRTDFNAAMQTLQETMKAVAGNTATIRSGAGEISSASDDLSRRTEQQAASLEETAAALDEITATVRKTAEGSKHARAVTSSAKVDAEQSGHVVQNAVLAMSGIEKSSQEIGNIIGVIDEIAFQTNLLALNAGVEAARAGDAGRGFAVVASEVRALAQRSATAAKEIKTLISTSGQQVKAGVELVGETGKALERIVIQVTEINGIVVEIAASAQEQATALNEVNSAVNQMDQVTQQNAAMVEQATAASQSLSQETEGLARLIGRFQVGLNENPRSSASRKPAYNSAPVIALKTTASGGAARKPSPTPMANTDSWEEF